MAKVWCHIAKKGSSKNRNIILAWFDRGICVAIICIECMGAQMMYLILSFIKCSDARLFQAFSK